MARGTRPWSGSAALSSAPGQRATIEQAKGIIGVLFALSPDEALLVLQACAQQGELNVHELARKTIELSAQPVGGDIESVRRRLTLLLFAGEEQAEGSHPGPAPTTDGEHCGPGAPGRLGEVRGLPHDRGREGERLA